jgi:hypothetical protein
MYMLTHIVLLLNAYLHVYTCIYPWSDNKVRELATVCLTWQHWTKALVWFYVIDISAFHRYMLLIYCSLFLSGIYYYLRVFSCAAAKMFELELEQ